VYQKIEKEIISYVLETTHWHRSKAAEILEISYKMLLTKIEELGLDPNLMSDGLQFKYLSAMEEIRFVQSKPEVIQFLNPKEPDIEAQSMAN